MKAVVPRKSARRAFIIIIIAGLSARICFGTFAQAASQFDAEPAWVNPSAMTLKQVGYVPSTGMGHTSMVDNLDCQEMTRPLMATGTAQSGCFMNTAFGSLDVENSILNLAGTDGAVIPLRPYSSRSFLLPWPGTTVALALEPAANDGAYLNLYTDILSSVRDELNITGTVIAKQVTVAPNKSIVDSAGNKLIVNANSLTFSSSGSWLVVETMTGSFVRINLATLEVKAFASSIIKVGSAAGLNASQIAVSDDGRYVAIANQAAETLRLYDLSSCQQNTGKPYLACSSYNYWPFVNSQIGAVDRLSHFRFLDAGLLSLVSAKASTVRSYLLAPTAGITSLTKYLAVGDSYTSGEGAYDYKDGTDTDDNACHLSNNSYPLLLTRSMFNSASGHSVACSGATAQDVLPNNALTYPGQVKNGMSNSQRTKDNRATILNDFSPGQLAQSDFVAHYQPGVLTVSIAGNDIGFGSILEECAAPHINIHLTGSNGCFSTYEDRLELAQRIDRQVSSLTTTLKKIRAKSPDTLIYVIGYPQIAVDTGSCAVNVHLNTSEIALSIEIIQHLNTAISQAAQASGSSYVDISQALAGHRLCETNSSGIAVNGLTAGKAGGIILNTELGDKLTLTFLGRESYHPNKLGHYLIEQAILKQTHNLSTSSVPALSVYPPAATDQASFLNKPKTGRATTIASRDDNMVKNKIVKAGGQLSLSIVSKRAGLKPKTPYIITTGLGGQVTSTSSVTTDISGDLPGSFTVPTTVQPGIQTLTISGANQLNQPISITTTVYVIYSLDDYDGDGRPNTSDSCPTTINSTADIDKDNIDDACDGLINNTAPVITGGTATPSYSNLPGPGQPADVLPVLIASPAPTVKPVSAISTPPAGSAQNISGSQLTGGVPGFVSFGGAVVAPPNNITVDTDNLVVRAGQVDQFKPVPASIKSVLGTQTINPVVIRSAAGQQVLSNSLSPFLAKNPVRIVQLLPFVRLFVLSLLMLVLVLFIGKSAQFYKNQFN